MPKTSVWALATALALNPAAGWSDADAPAAPGDSALQRPEHAPMHRVPSARRTNAASAPRALQPDEVPRVFGGTVAAPGAWPFQVALLFAEALDDDPESQYYAQFCGGSLIAAGWVLTAAHCVDDYGFLLEPDEITVLVGATALTGGERIAVTEVIAHPDYDPMRLDHDIALLRLAAPADHPAVALAAETAESGPVMVTGWGLTETGEFPDWLMQVEVDLQRAAACNAGIKDIYARDLAGILSDFAPRMGFSDRAIATAVSIVAESFADPLTGNMLCAGAAEGMRDACYGDSGGPLFAVTEAGPVQHGIVSWGEGPRDASAACGHANAYGVYTRVANYAGWIGRHLGRDIEMTR